MLSVLLAFAVAQAPTLQTIWTSRLQTEIQSHVVGEKAIFFGTNNSFGAISEATGKKIWSKSVNLPQLGVFVAQGDGLMFASVGQGSLYACQAGTGKVVWSIKRSGYASPIGYYNQMVYGEVDQGKLSALNPGGKSLWTSDLGKASLSARPIRFGKSVFIGLRSGTVMAFDKDTGKLAWKAAERKSAVQALLVAGERLIVTFDDGAILGLSLETGQKMWSVYTNNALFGMPLLRDGRLYAVSSSGRFYSIAAQTGEELWIRSLSFRQNFGLSQVIPWEDGFLMVDRALIVSLSGSGEKKWEIDTGSQMQGNQPRPLGSDLLLMSSHEFRRVRLISAH
jgi:outer membrane protein assembly factor BamB